MMKTDVPKGIQVSINGLADSVAFTSDNYQALYEFAKSMALKRGMRCVGGLRLNEFNITPTGSNYEPDLGVPIAHTMFTTAHQDLEFAGTKEPEVLTIFARRLNRSAPSSEGREHSLVSYNEYHFTLSIK